MILKTLIGRFTAPLWLALAAVLFGVGVWAGYSFFHCTEDVDRALDADKAAHEDKAKAEVRYVETVKYIDKYIQEAGDRECLTPADLRMFNDPDPHAVPE